MRAGRIKYKELKWLYHHSPKVRWYHWLVLAFVKSQKFYCRESYVEVEVKFWRRKCYLIKEKRMA